MSGRRRYKRYKDKQEVLDLYCQLAYNVLVIMILLLWLG